MAQDLSGLYISQSFQNLVQRSASGAFNVLATATGTEFIPVSASYAISASKADSVVSASYALSASHANTANTATSATTAVSASYALSSSFAVSASFAQRAVSSSHSDVNLQEVLSNGNSASIAINLTASLNTTASLTEHKNEFKVTAQDKDADFDVASFKVKNSGVGKTIITGSVEITGSSSVEGISTVSLNSAGTAAKIIIKDDGNTSFSVGPTLRFTGSRVGKIETERNFQIDVEGSGDTIFNAGNQYLFTKNSFQSGDFKITDPGARTAFYQHENLTETGSIRFANTTTDAGIAIRMDDAKMALQMYSGSSFVPIIQRLSGSKQVNLYDSTSSTGSSAQVLTSNANGGIEWAAGGGGGAAFPYTGSAQITGSLSVTGSTTIEGKVNIQSGANSGSANTTGLKDFLTVGYNNNNNTINGTIIGANNTVNGENSSIFGGDSVTINASYNSSMGAFNSTIDNTADASAMLGGYQNTLGGVRSALVGGRNNDIQASSDFGAIVGGFQNTISTGVTASAIIGGKNIVASKSNTAYVNGLEVTSLGANITGSIIGGGNIRAGQQAAAFSSDSIELGSATVPVQYGNFIIHGSNTRDLGNKYNGFQIQAVGGNTIQFANSAFTGLGNDVHLFSMGANSVGRTDSIKLWSSGSGADLNLSTDVVIQSGNKLTMSGSIELANSTGSVGQVIGVDASGKAKWETASGGGGITSFQLQPATSSYTQATAPGCDYVFQTASIAGGTFVPGDVLEIRSMAEQLGGSGTTYITFNMFEGNVSPGDPYPGGTSLALMQSQNSADGKLYFQKTLWIQSATRTAVWNTGNPNETAYSGVTGGDPIEIEAIDWTQDQTFWYGACIDNAGHTLENFGGIIRKLN